MAAEWLKEKSTFVTVAVLEIIRLANERNPHQLTAQIALEEIKNIVHET